MTYDKTQDRWSVPLIHFVFHFRNRDSSQRKLDMNLNACEDCFARHWACGERWAQIICYLKLICHSGPPPCKNHKTLLVPKKTLVNSNTTTWPFRTLTTLSDTEHSCCLCKSLSIHIPLTHHQSPSDCQLTHSTVAVWPCLVQVQTHTSVLKY